MGILNVTPDSFADAAPRTDPAQAADHALRLEAEGADLIDVGGESTRPGAEPVTVEEELARVIPVLRRLAGRLRVPISIDTYKARVAEAALAEGAAIVNDISGLRYDSPIAAVAAAGGAALVLMHTRGRSRTMYREAIYAALIPEVVAELGESLAMAVAAGVPRERVILDPGLGFAKEARHSLELLARLSDLAVLERPLLVGPSRKSFLKAALGERPPGGREFGTAAAVAAAVLGGAHIVRVHAVREMCDVVRVADEIRTRAGR
ncbi:MAG: dihydropteroate synthase [Acidobacteria bacterium]|nr:dihydropteroate synthase [Acidobacteriota bacterium]